MEMSEELDKLGEEIQEKHSGFWANFLIGLCVTIDNVNFLMSHAHCQPKEALADIKHDVDQWLEMCVAAVYEHTPPGPAKPTREQAQEYVARAVRILKTIEPSPAVAGSSTIQ